MEHGQWGGAIDSLGGDVLAWLTRTVRPWGNIASVGLAAGAELNTSVMPFILRSVSLLGCYMEVPDGLRTELWNQLGGDSKPRHLEQIVTREVTLDELPGAFDAFIEGSVTGRTLVKVSSPPE